MTNQKTMSQFFTPVWAAEILFNEHFGHLTPNDMVWEPSCGTGAFLSAVPRHIPAVGSDVDPAMVQAAMQNTGRQVYQGDFRTIAFDHLADVTAIIGNPPFKLPVFEQFMQRAATILSIGRKAGFILPAYFFQTSQTFMRFARRWEIEQEIIPRDLFKGTGLLSKPLIFACFTRQNSPKFVGFRLHAELFAINALNAGVRQVLTTQINRPGSIWAQVAIYVTQAAGGTITLQQLYKHVEGCRPTPNPFWKEQIRKVLRQAPFKKINTATYQLN